MQSRAFSGRAAGGSCCPSKCERRTMNIIEEHDIEN